MGGVHVDPIKLAISAVGPFALLVVMPKPFTRRECEDRKSQNNRRGDLKALQNHRGQD